MAWLACNPSGVPRRHAIGRALFGVGLGMSGGLLMSALLADAYARPLHVLGLDLFLGSITGAILGPLLVLFVARLFDRTFAPDDQLIGYSGVIRLLLHAGELSFLGGLAGGIGGGGGTALVGLISGGLATALVGAILYHARGFGMWLGSSLGIVIGALGGGMGGAIAFLGG